MRSRWMGVLLLVVAALPAQGLVKAPDWSLVPAVDRTSLQEGWSSALAILADEGVTLADDVVVRAFPQEAAVMVMLTRDANPSLPPRTLTLDPRDSHLPLILARALEAISRTTVAMGTGPTLIDTLNLGDLRGVDLPVGTYLAPYGLATRSNGNLLVASFNTVLELDDRWNLKALPTKALNAAGVSNYAYGLTLSPSGTLYIRNADGTGVWSLPEGSETPQRLRVEVPAGASFGVLSDGSAFVASMTTRTVSVYDAGVARPLPLPAGSYVMAAAAGPENTLWLSDMVRGDLRVVSPQGDLLNLLYPELPPGAAIYRLIVGSDGAFFAITGQDLRRYDRRGRLLWAWSPATEGLSLTLSTLTDLTLDAQGILTLNDPTGRRLVRLAENPERLSAVWRSIIDANRKIRQKPDEATAWLALADAYEAQGSLEALRPALEQARDLRPGDARTRERLLKVEVALLKAKSAAGEADFAALLKRFGPETARDAYARTMKTLESLQDLAPHDGDVTRRVLALRKAMNAAESALTPPPRLPQVVEVALPALFPSLLQAYRARPAGTVTLLNDLGEALSDVQVDLLVPGFMDLPSSGPVVKRVEAGAQATLNITALLGPRVLSVEEDLPLQVLLTIRFRDASGVRSFELRRPLTLYRRTALTWDDTRKLASFVTPNEEGLERAAFQMLAATAGEPRLVSATLQRAAALCDALGSLPLQYIPDPKSNFSLVSTDPGLIDTVRFPRTTLTLQGGDCDDSTALLASLLESTGIPTAILTSPGHVFLAFDTGEKPENAWLFQGEGLVTVEHGGSLWIPLESTDLKNGFVQSWSRASGLVAAYRGTPALEFLPVAELRATYPALPLPASTLPLPRPAEAATAQLHHASQSALFSRVFEPQAAAMTKASLSLSGRDKSKAGNKLAQLYLRFGQTDKAVAELTRLVAADPGYATAYLNLAVIRFDQGNKAEAQKWVAAAAKAAPGPTVTKFAEKLGMASNAVATAPGTGGSDGGRAGLDTGDLWVGD